jgi:hypothetical protein
MSASGIIMVMFHSGSVKIEQSVFGVTGYNWYIIHKILILTSTVLAIVHLSLHPQWMKNVVKGNMFPKSFTLKMSFWLLVIFLLNAVLSLSSWLIVDNSTVDTVLHGLHSKTGLVLIVIFSFHLVQHFKSLLTTCKVMIKN